MSANLVYVKNVDFSGITSIGPNQAGNEIEPVDYTSYTIIGTLVIDGKGKFNDYAFYVRISTQDCKVLKVALLRAGESPYVGITPTESAKTNPSGLVSQEAILAKIGTPTDGSPKIGFTYVGPGEESQAVVNDQYLRSLKERAEILVERF